ncbi:MAG: NAD-dependent epimerase/dehydratase family protein [Deltaproteobacteria bacterium]|nr:NAD-dependent epimerase/dehydratase family protein [Deltaproteobacteria bacterium]
MRVLVTGAGGFVGSHVAAALVARGDSVRGFSRGTYPELERLGVEQLRGDLANPDAVKRAVEGVDAVVHAGAKVGIWGPFDEFFEANVVGTRNVLGAMRHAGVGRLVFTSTPSVVYADGSIEGGDESLPHATKFLCAYPATKSVAEKEALAAHEQGRMQVIALRPHLVFGPGDRQVIPRMLDAARKGQLRRVGDGNNMVSVSYIENVTDAHLLALDATAHGHSPAGGKVYFVNEPEPVSLWSFLDRVLTGFGAPRVERSVPYGVARALGATLELVYRGLGKREEPRMTRFLAAQLGTSHWFKVGAIERDLGWKPRVGVDEALDRLFRSV